MTKKILAGVVALVAVAGGVAGLSAFEAHVINVTAQIENALEVAANAIDFGTVFPQEHLNQPLRIALSSSFLTEDRVDDVRYIIRQKPKCGITSSNGTVLDHASTQTGHVIPTVDDPTTTEVDESKGGTAYTIDCGRAPRELVNDEVYGVLPSLCEYISKEGDDEDGTSEENDGTTPSFHEPWTVASSTVVWLDTPGLLLKSASDTLDTWVIDLAVPCFGEHCAQDWATFVGSINPLADPNEYILDENLEHKIFGCDLWVEVTEVSETRVEI